ncbi:hypothetical protein [Methylobacterium nonmethylotrophicum]|uniref:Uncharacterized protein n=1 Tax=Methylobacterium nonmethylotrophicum TaxID=1141884 RepID=A0A4Z0NM06_9HYPH|nr:hypothetical protein [Methylobacterium nonmethylotrophicum]TGD97600.1 hypothetical protein EU555_18320 [Methylobacterium nonmethylotrophicum]
MVDQNDVAGAPAPDGATSAPAKGGVPSGRSWSMKAWPKLKTTTAAGLLCAGCVGALAGGATVALMNAAQGGGAGIPQAEWSRLSGRVEAGAAESARLATDLSLLRDRTVQAHEAADKGRAETGARLAQVTERLERLQRQDGDLAGKVASVAERLAAMAERQERAEREQAARLAALSDKIEKRQAGSPVAAAPAAPAPVAAVAPAPAPRTVAAAEPALTGSLPDRPVEKAKPATIDGWVLRDVYDGMAILENRNRRLVEVSLGDTLPGGGRVEAIERRGRSWVVITSKGLITPQAW